MTYIRIGDAIVTRDTFWAYITGLGWIKRSSLNSQFVEFEAPESDDTGNPITLIFSKSIDPHHELAFLQSSIDTVRQYYGISALNLGAAITTFDGDLIRNRVLKSSPNSIPLHLANRLINSISATGSDANRTERLLTVNPIIKLPDFGQMSYFGHTFIGSFGLSIFTPLPTDIQIGLENEGHQVPFQRRVLERLTRNLKTVESLSTTSDIDSIIDPEDGNRAISRKFCNSISNIWTDKFAQDIEYAFNWSPKWQLAKDLMGIKQIELTPKIRPFLQTAAKILKAQEIPKTQVVMGIVSDLHKKWGDYIQTDKDRKKVVTIAWQPHPNQKRILNVRVELSKELHDIAEKSHIEQKTIQIEGELIRKAPFYILTNPRNLKTIG